jgi:hypothetical protein
MLYSQKSNMRKFLNLLFVIVFSSVNMVAQEKISRYDPSADPDRIILNISGDATTSMAVTWRTDTTVNESVAQLSPNLSTVHLADTAITVTGTYKDVAGDGFVSRYHSVNFTGLTPDKGYAYRVGSGTNASEWFTFTTASSASAPLTFIYLGDSQGSNALYSRVVRQAYRSAPDASFMIFSGDLVDGGSGGIPHDEEWGSWHAAGGFIHAEVPVLPTPGNHEYYDPAVRGKRELNRHWRAGFTLPENGPEGLEETAYYVDYQGVRFIFLNSDVMMRNESLANSQTMWLEELLKNNPYKWTVMTFHHPLYSTSARRDNTTIRERLKPLIDKYNVDLVLTGHDHTYARGQMMPDGLEKKGRRAGTVYVVSVSGAKQYQQDAAPWWDRGMAFTQTWQEVTVNGNILTYNAYDASGSLVDHFTLKKKRDDRNLIINSAGAEVL